LAGPGVALAWSLAAAAYLRRDLPSPSLACLDCAVYGLVVVFAQGCVPPEVRDSAFSWVVISASGQLMVPSWYAPGAVSALIAVQSPLAYLTGALLQPVSDVRTMTGAALLLLVIGVGHGYGRRVLFGRAAVADANLRRADQAASDQYAMLRAARERRENERLVHDTVLNTLTALSLADGGDPAMAASRCRQDVGLIEEALHGAGQPAVGSLARSGDLQDEVRAVAAAMRARGLTVHLDLADREQLAVPAPVVLAFSNAAREALSNVAAHAGTGEAWVEVRTGPSGLTRRRLELIVRDRGAGFDPARVDQGRLGLKRSITERAAECGGRASVWSAPGQGTEVALCWPAAPPSPRPAGPVPAGRDLAPRESAGQAQPW
jgi:signal transduction histidine kinase